MLKQRLVMSKYGEDDCIADMVAAFESRVSCIIYVSLGCLECLQTKRLFDGEQRSYAVDFGSSRDNDRPNGILKGRLSLTKAEVASTFESVVQQALNSCSALLRGQKVKVRAKSCRSLSLKFPSQHILLVGGLGESIYLKKKLGELFSLQGTTVVTVEEQTCVVTSCLCMTSHSPLFRKKAAA